MSDHIWTHWILTVAPDNFLVYSSDLHRAHMPKLRHCFWLDMVAALMSLSPSTAHQTPKHLIAMWTRRIPNSPVTSSVLASNLRHLCDNNHFCTHLASVQSLQFLQLDLLDRPTRPNSFGRQGLDEQNAFLLNTDNPPRYQHILTSNHRVWALTYVPEWQKKRKNEFLATSDNCVGILIHNYIERPILPQKTKQISSLHQLHHDVQWIEVQTDTYHSQNVFVFEIAH